MKEEPEPIPKRPAYDGPADPGPFSPSSELASLYKKRERYEARVDNAYRNRQTKMVIEWVEDELEKVEREVAPVE